MNKSLNTRQLSLSTVFSYIAIITLLILMVPAQAFAAGLNSRSLTLGSSAGNTATSWTFTFNATDTTSTLKGFSFQVCDAASGTCNAPGSWSNSGAAFNTTSGLKYNGTNQSGWTTDHTSGQLRIKNNSASAAPAVNPVTVAFTNVTNPNTTNATFYVRVVAYSGNDFSTPGDTGVVAASTSQQLSVTASVDETLTFCTGTSGITNSSCSGATGSTVGLGSLTPSTTGSSTSQFGVGTNAGSGYAVTVNGTTLTCAACAGSPTISALGSQAASDDGTEQFGLNLRDNATPNIGSEPDGDGTASPTANYNTANQYRFVTGDSVASKGSSDKFRLFTAAYIANIDTATEPGAYSTTLTYIATATF